MNQLNDFKFWSSLKSKESILLKEVRDNINSNINVQAGTTIDRKGFGPHKMNRYTISRLIMCAIRTNDDVIKVMDKLSNIISY